MLTEKRLGFIPFTLSKRAYRGWVDAAKKQYNMNKIVMAKNPCKAAWNLVSQTYNGKQTMKYSAIPDDFNSYLLGEVDNIVNSVALDGDSGHKHVTIFLWPS